MLVMIATVCLGAANITGLGWNSIAFSSFNSQHFMLPLSHPAKR